MKKNWKTVLAMTALTLAVGTTVAMPASAGKPQQQSAIVANTTATELSTLSAAFNSASTEFSVPKELLMAISYNESRWQPIIEEAHVVPEPAKNGGVGYMHLTDSSTKKGLTDAAQALGVTPGALKTSTELNIRAGAYLLSKYQKALNKPLSTNVNDWYEAVAAYLGSDNQEVSVLFADAVYDVLKSGAAVTTADGGSLSLQPASVAPNKGKYTGVTYGAVTTTAPDYSGAIWNPASSSNYAVDSRPSTNPIKYIIIHDTEGSYSGTISWFQDPAAQVSAHYVVRSSDGQITQMVQEKDVAWHARSFNTNGIGIEHEGYAAQTGWYTDAMYQKSAALTKYLCQKYGLPMDRNTILGHEELWGNDHDDPGKNWDWNKYMYYVTGINKNWSVVVADDSYASVAFYGPSTYWRTVTGYGLQNQMHWTNGNGTTLSNYAIWTPSIPTAGNYEVKVFIPSNYAATTNAKYEIHYNGGIITKAVNQNIYSNQWVSLGTYSFAAGTTGYVKLGDNTGDTVNIGVDAMKFMAQ